MIKGLTEFLSSSGLDSNQENPLILKIRVQTVESGFGQLKSRFGQLE